MWLQNYKKIISLLSIIGLLLVGVFLSLYNDKKEVVSAQVTGEILWKCGEEIVIGEVIVEASQVANNITNAFNEITKASSQQILLAEKIYQSPLPQACKASNCNTGCDRWCVDEDGDSVCSDDEWHCKILPCSGDACPVDKLIEDIENANRIANLHNDIEASVKLIKSEAGKRGDIIEKLNKAREQLALCVTPPGGHTPEEWAQKQKSLLPCDLAKRLSPDVEECSNENNFFCCTPIFY